MLKASKLVVPSPVIFKVSLVNGGLPYSKSQKTTYRVPSGCGGEALGEAAWVASIGNVVEDGRAVRRVQQRVEESERLASAGEKVGVDQRNAARERGGRATGAVNSSALSIDDDIEVNTLVRYIGEATASRVEETCIGVAELLEVRANRILLVRRASKQVGETTRREVSCNLRRDVLSRANGSDAGNHR